MVVLVMVSLLKILTIEDSGLIIPLWPSVSESLPRVRLEVTVFCILHLPRVTLGVTAKEVKSHRTRMTLYVLNAAALMKPGAVDHLATDLQSTGASVTVRTETHFKQKHSDSVTGIDVYTVFRRDKSAGVAAEWRCTCSRTYSHPLDHRRRPRV